MSAYLQPETLEDALAFLQDETAVIAAGCTDLFASTEARSLKGRVLDVTRIAELRGVTRTEAGWRIGAATTWSDVIKADLPPAFDMLKAAAREVGSVQIQNAGTLAGNLCNASPAADGVPPLLALDAQVELAQGTTTRRMALSDFITGVRQTALGPGELVSAIHVPCTAGAGESRFLKLGARKYLVISIAMVALRLVIKDNAIESIALAVGACSPVATRLPELESRLQGQPVAEADAILDAANLSTLLSPIDDVRATSGYRETAARTLLKRGVADLTRGAV